MQLSQLFTKWTAVLIFKIHKIPRTPPLHTFCTIVQNVCKGGVSYTVPFGNFLELPIFTHLPPAKIAYIAPRFRFRQNTPHCKYITPRCVLSSNGSRAGRNMHIFASGWSFVNISSLLQNTSIRSSVCLIQTKNTA